MSELHKNPDVLHEEIEHAKQSVSLGGTYVHYKDPSKYYRAMNVGILEATDEISVIYQALYDEELLFVRPLTSWLEKVLHDGRTVDRFTLIH